MRVFIEKQRFTQLWLWVILIGSSVGPSLLLLWGCYKQLITRQPWGDSPMSDEVLIIVTILVILFSVAIIMLFVYLKLETKISEKEILFRFVPFHNKFRRIPLVEIDCWRVRTYKPIREFGGWGLRYGTKKSGIGTAYNVRGNVGLEIRFTNRKNILIGTQKGPEMRAFLSLYATHKECSGN